MLVNILVIGTDLAPKQACFKGERVTYLTSKTRESSIAQRQKNSTHKITHRNKKSSNNNNIIIYYMRSAPAA